MYLSLLNDEQKNLFCNMAYSIVMSDGVFRDEEKDLLESYRGELGYYIDLDEVMDDFDETLEKIFAVTSIKERRIIVFECIALAIIDSDYASQERNLIERMITRFGITAEYENDCIKVVREYIDFQKKINEIVLVNA